MSKSKRKKNPVQTVIAHKEEYTLLGYTLAMFWAYIRMFFKFIFHLIFIILITAAICLGIGGFIFYQKYISPYDSAMKQIAENSTVEDFKMNQSSYIYDSDGEKIAKLSSGRDAAYLKYDDIPKNVTNAFISVEDRTFWNNPGYDLKGIARVVYYYAKTKGTEAHGASTITQQLARSIYLTQDVSISRKIKEILLSKYLTQKYSKKQIMEFYCNDVCFANANYGIEAAAESYFSKKASDLSLSEIAYLCAIPNRPSYYDPIKHPNRALERRNKILDDMQEMGFISTEECEKAKEEIIYINPSEKKQNIISNDYETTYATDCAVRWIMQKNGFEFQYKFADDSSYALYNDAYDSSYEEATEKLYTQGYRIYTSLDSNMQNNLQKILDDSLSFEDTKNEKTGIYAFQGAVTCVDNSSGLVKAVIGGRSQDNSTYTLNRAYQSYRQPGSSIKPIIVYTPALENGYTPDSVVENIDVTEAKKPGVDTSSLHGEQISLRSAVENSKNGCAWQIFNQIGAYTGLKKITDMGYQHIVPEDYTLASALGGFTYGVTTVEQAGAYSALVNHGRYNPVTCITKITDAAGNDLYTAPDKIQIYQPAAADTMVDIMQGVITSGTAKSMKWSKSSKMAAAGKTGTTNDSKDGWFCGVTPYYSIAVWVGYDTPKTLNGLYGGSYPAEIWKKSMLSVIDGKEAKEFDKSEEYNDYIVSANQTEKYLPGRDDSEILSDGYTVGDYRDDHEMGEKVAVVLNTMATLSRATDTNYDNDATALYMQAAAGINSIKSNDYRTELTTQLNNAYMAACMKK